MFIFPFKFRCLFQANTEHVKKRPITLQRMEYDYMCYQNCNLCKEYVNCNETNTEYNQKAIQIESTI